MYIYIVAIKSEENCIVFYPNNKGGKRKYKRNCLGNAYAYVNLIKNKMSQGYYCLNLLFQFLTLQTLFSLIPIILCQIWRAWVQSPECRRGYMPDFREFMVVYVLTILGTTYLNFIVIYIEGHICIHVCTM